MKTLKQKIAALEPWFQRIEFTDPVTNEKISVGNWHTREMFDLLMAGVSLAGHSFFDIGAMSGASMLLAEAQGAVCYGIDPDERAVKQMALVKEQFNANFEFWKGSVHETLLFDKSVLDYVYFTGVYYHLRHPLLGLEDAWENTGKALFIEGEILYGEDGCYARFYPEDYRGDRSNWWVPTVECFTAWVNSLPGDKHVKIIYPMTSVNRIGAVVARV